MARTAKALGKTDDATHYENKQADYTRALMNNFWDSDRQMFDDFYIDKDGTKKFDGHTGYLNFWPFFLNVLDPSDEKFKLSFEKLVAADSCLVTEHGVRSLSCNDPYYKLGDNYWTSPIWMNINFLIIKSLYGYSLDVSIEEPLRGEIQSAYTSLRQGVIDMISNEYHRTGFIWEVYDGDQGQGRDNHPFTGWSALYLNILSEIY